jgi:hypothetical protein
MSIEHRDIQRYSALIEISVNKIKIPSTNISNGGMQLICDRMTCNMLKRQIKDDMTGITIPIPKGITIEVSCKVAYISIYDDSEYLVGLEFETFSGDGKDTLERYIKENAGKSLKLISQ